MNKVKNVLVNVFTLEGDSYLGKEIPDAEIVAEIGFTFFDNDNCLITIPIHQISRIETHLTNED